MHADVREHQHVKAGTALAAASVVALAPIAPVTSLPSAASAVNRAVQLVAGEDSFLNAPLNLFQDIANVPSNEVEAINEFSKSLFFAGNWFTPSATNLWGTDPGDYGHYAAILSLLFPFREISGLGQPEIDSEALANGTAGLGQQFNLLAAAEFQTSASSDADWSAPLVPATPITGLAALDRVILSVMAFTGQQQFPLIDNWFQVPLSDLANGYTFDDSDIGPDHNLGILTIPSMGVGPNGAVLPGFGFDGSKPLVELDANGDPVLDDDGNPIPVLNDAGNPINLEPFAGETFKLNLFGPFQKFFESLQAAPDSDAFSFHYGLPDDLDNGLAAPLTGITLPSFDDIIHAFQALVASMVVAFDPFVPGSPVCIGECADGVPQLISMVEFINDLYPGNSIINEWLTDVNTDNPYSDPDNPNLDLTGIQTGIANWSTPHQIFTDINYLQGAPLFLFDFGNPGPDDPPLDGPFGVDTPISFPLASSLQNLIDLMQSSGVQDFVHKLADMFGYEPIDYGTDTGESGDPGDPDDSSDMSGSGDEGDAGSAAATDTDNIWTELMNPSEWGSLF